MKAKIYIGAKKYALYIGRKIVEKTLEFLTLPARFISNKVQDLKNLTMWGNSVQTSARTRNLYDKDSIPLNAYVTNQGVFTHATSKTWVIEVKPNTTYTLSYDNSMIGTNPRCSIVGFENKPAIGSTDATSYYTNNNSAKKQTITFTTDNNINYIALWLVHALGVEGIQEALSTAQLEEGNTATPYVPYIATTPTPETPIEVESVGDRTSNLFDGEWEYGNIDASGNVIISTSPATWIHGKNRIKVKPNTRYWFRFFGDVTRTSAQFYIIEYDKDDKFIAGKRVSVGSIISKVDGNYYDMTSNVGYIRFFYSHNVEESTSLDTDRYKLSIEERSNVIPSFEPYGYKVPVTVCGKNLFDETLPNEIEGVYVEYPLSLESGKTYALSLEKNNCYQGGSPYPKQYVFVINKQGLTSNWTQNPLAYFGNTNTAQKPSEFIFNVPSEGLSLYVYWGGSTTKPNDYLEILDTLFGNMQIELGDTVTEYVPYIQPTTTNIYLNEPLRKIGEYADYIDFENKKVVRNIGETKPTSYKKGLLAGSHYRFSTTISNIKIPVSIQDRLLILSDKYIADLTPTSYSETTSQYAITGYTGANQVYIYDKDLDNEQSKTTDIDCLIYYIQATPTEETIDIPAINIPQGTLTIDTDTIIKPSKIEITGDIDNVD